MVRRFLTHREQAELVEFWQSEFHRESRADFPYLRNNGGMRQHWQPEDFGQEHEPWGRYMSPDENDTHPPLQKGWERGTVGFDNPLYVPHNYGAWKQELSQAHGGLTGQALSDALLAKGHDGVVTHDKYGLGEIVDIRPKNQRGHTVARKQGRRVITHREQAEMLEAWRVAGLEENDPLWELLGLPPGGNKPSYNPEPVAPRPKENPIPGVPSGWERYHNHISRQPDTSANAHLMMPIDLVSHYQEYHRDPADPQYQTLKKVITDHGGIRQPLVLSTNGTHGLLTEGNHRAAIAKDLGITHLPVKVYHDDEVQRNEGTPVAHHPDFVPWLEQNKDRLPKFFS